MGFVIENSELFKKDNNKEKRENNNQSQEIIKKETVKETKKEEQKIINLNNIKLEEGKKKNNGLLLLFTSLLLIGGGLSYIILNQDKEMVGVPISENNLKVSKNNIKIEVEKNKMSILDIKVNDNERKLTLLDKKKEEIKKEIKTKLEKPKPLNRIHIVKAGDTFYEIALKYEMSYKKLMELNGKSKNRLKIGEELYIDKTNPKLLKKMKKEQEKKHNKTEKIKISNNEKEKVNIVNLFKNVGDDNLQLKSKEEKEIKNLREYIVKKGDTLYGIALENNTTIEEIKKKSKKKNNILKVGEKLYF